jgi:LuxR family maltose regulon positive regulatory protein
VAKNLKPINLTPPPTKIMITHIMSGAEPRKADDLLHTKLMPPRLGAALVPRHDLLARLDAGLARKLTLVAAPAGFGKTTLVGMWVQRGHFPCAWLTLDSYDNDSCRFWTYLVSALRTFDPALGRTTLAALTGSQPPAFQNLITPLVNDLTQLSEPLALVLDNYHAITSPEIHQQFTFLLQHLPAPLHIVLTSRHEPELPLASLRVRDELVEIDAGDLRFSQDETQAFLSQSLQTDFPPATTARLFQKTDGWPAGLRLLALSLQNQSAGEIEERVASFSGGERYVADYLTQEVVASQPQAIQNFLLQTCFLDRLAGPLCEAITETSGAARLLEQLERQNLFLEPLQHGSQRVWYRYNPLFAESLQYLARRRLGEPGIRAIYEKASAWFESQQLYEEAIEAALPAGLFSETLALIARYVDIHGLNELSTLERWLQAVPVKETLRHPDICFIFAQVILYAGDRFAPATAVRVEPLLQAAEKAWRSSENHQALGDLLCLRGLISAWQGDLRKAYAYAHQALDEIPEHDVLWRGIALLLTAQEALSAGRILDTQDQILEARALLGAAQNNYGVLAAMRFLSQAFYWQGDLDQAEALNRRISTEAVGDESMLDDQGYAALGLARIAYERDDLDQAGQFAAQALDLGHQRANEQLVVPASLQMAHIHAARGARQQAGELLHSLAARIQNPDLLHEIQDAQAELSIRAGEFAALDGWLALVSREPQARLDLQKEREAFTRARLHNAQGRPDEALQALAGWQADAAQNGRIRSQLEALCLAALAHQAQGDRSRAAQRITQALEIGQMKGLRRLFLDFDRPMANLLQASLASLSEPPLSLYAAGLLQSFASQTGFQPATEGPVSLIEPLSEQEMRVLRLLVAGLSNAEIASELIVSINTVKTHVKHIYSKLDVHSRSQAREAAREWKLL